jgi:hypothetical protein
MQQLNYAIKGYGVSMKTNMFCVREYDENIVIFADREPTDQLKSYRFATWQEVQVESACVRKAFYRDTPTLLLMENVIDDVRDEINELQRRIDSLQIIASPPASVRRVPVEHDAASVEAVLSRMHQITSMQAAYMDTNTPHLLSIANAIETHKQQMCGDFLTRIANPAGIKMYLSNGVRIVDLCADNKAFAEVAALLRKKSLPRLTKFQRKNCLFLCTFNRAGKIISVMSILFAVIKNMPVRMAVSIEHAASVEKHQSSRIWDVLVYSLKRRKAPLPCIIVVQAALTPIAERFWAGKMTSSSYAPAIIFMFAMLSSHYRIYMDVNFKILHV